MNRVRRRKIQKALEVIDEARGILEECQEEESEAYDNMPEWMQEREEGEKMQDCIDALEEACESIDELIENLVDVCELEG